MAAVYEAENVDIGKRVAVKVLAAGADRLDHRGRALPPRGPRGRRHPSPYICDVYDSGKLDDGRPSWCSSSSRASRSTSG